MEHRWGLRLRVERTARVGDRAGSIGMARVRDLSISGAFLETTVALQPFSRIEVQLLPSMPRGSSAAIAAYVVRRTRDGVGIEWCEFSPPAVAAILRTAPVAVAGASSASHVNGRRATPSQHRAP